MRASRCGSARIPAVVALCDAYGGAFGLDQRQPRRRTRRVLRSASSTRAAVHPLRMPCCRAKPAACRPTEIRDAHRRGPAPLNPRTYDSAARARCAHDADPRHRLVVCAAFAAAAQSSGEVRIAGSPTPPASRPARYARPRSGQSQQARDMLRPKDAGNRRPAAPCHGAGPAASAHAGGHHLSAAAGDVRMRDPRRQALHQRKRRRQSALGAAVDAGLSGRAPLRTSLEAISAAASPAGPTDAPTHARHPLASGDRRWQLDPRRLRDVAASRSLRTPARPSRRDPHPFLRRRCRPSAMRCEEERGINARPRQRLRWPLTCAGPASSRACSRCWRRWRRRRTDAQERSFYKCTDAKGQYLAAEQASARRARMKQEIRRIGSVRRCRCLAAKPKAEAPATAPMSFDFVMVSGPNMKRH